MANVGRRRRRRRTTQLPFISNAPHALVLWPPHRIETISLSVDCLPHNKVPSLVIIATKYNIVHTDRRPFTLSKIQNTGDGDGGRTAQVPNVRACRMLFYFLFFRFFWLFEMNEFRLVCVRIRAHSTRPRPRVDAECVWEREEEKVKYHSASCWQDARTLKQRGCASGLAGVSERVYGPHRTVSAHYTSPSSTCRRVKLCNRLHVFNQDNLCDCFRNAFYFVFFLHFRFALRASSGTNESNREKKRNEMKTVLVVCTTVLYLQVPHDVYWLLIQLYRMLCCCCCLHQNRYHHSVKDSVNVPRHKQGDESRKKISVYCDFISSRERENERRSRKCCDRTCIWTWNLCKWRSL